MFLWCPSPNSLEALINSWGTDLSTCSHWLQWLSWALGKLVSVWRGSLNSAGSMVQIMGRCNAHGKTTLAWNEVVKRWFHSTCTQTTYSDLVIKLVQLTDQKRLTVGGIITWQWSIQPPWLSFCATVCPFFYTPLSSTIYWCFFGFLGSFLSVLCLKGMRGKRKNTKQLTLFLSLVYSKKK